MRRAFTLVELLVVITIIVVLLALLAPALDRAVYQAELVQCAARQRGGACTAVVAYAAGSRRFYPRHTYSSAYTLKESADLFRPVLRTAMSLNATLNDPFTPRQVNLDTSPAVAVSSSYQLWFGYGYTVGGEKMMLKLGDRWTYTSPVAPFPVHRFSLLTNDVISGTLAAGVSAPSGAIYSYHLDQGNTLVPETYDNQVPPSAIVAGMGISQPTGATYTFSRWRGTYTSRTRVDFNYGYDDTSVARLTDITIDGQDDRVTPVAVYASKAGNQLTFGFYVPVEKR